MEQKKVQRIVGIMVVIALVIVVMPLLFGKNNFPVQQAANIKAPPFPDQPQATDTTPADVQTPALASTTNADKDSNAEQQNNSATPVTQPGQTTGLPDQTADNAKLPVPPVLSGEVQQASVNNQPSDAPKVDSSQSANSATDKQTVVITPEMAKKIHDDSAAAGASSINDNKSASPPGTIIYEPVTTPAITAPSVTPNAPEQPVKNSVVAAAVTNVPTEKSESAIVVPAKPVIAKVKNAPPRQKVAHVKSKSKALSFVKSTSSAAWVVQMGNFSIRQNAVHLANVLEASGYKAFIQDVTFSNGKVRTRVYIGPEFKQASATRLSKDIKQKLSMQGFVVPYSKA